MSDNDQKSQTELHRSKNYAGPDTDKLVLVIVSNK